MTGYQWIRMVNSIDRRKRAKSIQIHASAFKWDRLYGFGTSARNSASCNWERIRITSRYWIVCDPSDIKEDNEKATTGWKQIRVLFTDNALIYTTGSILIGAIHFIIQWDSRDIWTSRPPVATVLNGRKAGAKLHRTASRYSQVDSLQGIPTTILAI